MIGAAAALDALLEAERRTEGLHLLSAPMFVMGDGDESRVSDGEDVRIARTNVSPEGTVTVVGFDTIRTGLEVIAGVRDVGSGRARLSVQSSISEIVGFNDGLPIVNQQEFSTRAIVHSQGVYLIGSLERSRRLEAVDGVFQSVKEDERESGTVYIWARTYRIAGGVHRF